MRTSLGAVRVFCAEFSAIASALEKSVVRVIAVTN